MSNQETQPDDIKYQCPRCESVNLKEEIVVDNFEYGAGEDELKLSASIPVVTCNDCGEAFTDFRAAEIKELMIKNVTMKVLK